MTEAVRIDLLKRASTPNGQGLRARKAIVTGEICLQEVPRLLAPISLEGLYARFLALTDDDIQMLAHLDANVFALSQRDEDDIAARVPKDSSFSQGFRWFVALMKCNGHGLAHGSDVWAIYEKAVNANHSCEPNMSYRNENGVLTYVAIRDIAEGEEATVSYIDGLYASQRFRVNKLLEQKLFLCQCRRCEKEVDPLRRVWCPHCRTKDKEESKEGGEKPKVTPAFATFVGAGSGLKHLPQFQLTKKANAGQIGKTDEWWTCTTCGMTYSSAVLPVAVESALEALFTKLDSSFGQPDPVTWSNYLLYLYRTSLMVLGPMHWLLGGCFFLFSRFYAGVWNGGGGELKHRDLALDHAEKFFQFVEAVAKEAECVDVLPWASVTMRLALGSGQLEKFAKLTRKYLVPLRTLYGQRDPTVVAYEEAIQYLHAGGLQEPDQAKLLGRLQAFAQQSARPTPDSTALKKVVPRSERIWLKPRKLQFDWAILERAACKRTCAPWTQPKSPPPKFIEFARQQLAAQQQIPGGSTTEEVPVTQVGPVALGGQATPSWATVSMAGANQVSSIPGFTATAGDSLPSAIVGGQTSSYQLLTPKQPSPLPTAVTFRPSATQLPSSTAEKPKPNATSPKPVHQRRKEQARREAAAETGSKRQQLTIPLAEDTGTAAGFKGLPSPHERRRHHHQHKAKRSLSRPHPGTQSGPTTTSENSHSNPSASASASILVKPRAYSNGSFGAAMTGSFGLSQSAQQNAASSSWQRQQLCPPAISQTPTAGAFTRWNLPHAVTDHALPTVTAAKGSHLATPRQVLPSNGSVTAAVPYTAGPQYLTTVPVIGPSTSAFPRVTKPGSSRTGTVDRPLSRPHTANLGYVSAPVTDFYSLSNSARLPATVGALYEDRCSVNPGSEWQVQLPVESMTGSGSNNSFRQAVATTRRMVRPITFQSAYTGSLSFDRRTASATAGTVGATSRTRVLSDTQPQKKNPIVWNQIISTTPKSQGSSCSGYLTPTLSGSRRHHRSRSPGIINEDRKRKHKHSAKGSRPRKYSPHSESDLEHKTHDVFPSAKRGSSKHAVKAR